MATTYVDRRTGKVVDVRDEPDSPDLRGRVARIERVRLDDLAVLPEGADPASLKREPTGAEIERREAATAATRDSGKRLTDQADRIRRDKDASRTWT